MTSSDTKISSSSIFFSFMFFTKDQLSLTCDAGFLIEVINIPCKYLATLYRGLPKMKRPLEVEIQVYGFSAIRNTSVDFHSYTSILYMCYRQSTRFCAKSVVSH